MRAGLFVTTGILLAYWVFAYLPERTGQVGSEVMALCLLICGLCLLLRNGQFDPSGAWPMNLSRRAAGWLNLLLGCLFGVGGFVVNTAGPCKSCIRDPWGGTLDIAALVVFVVWAAAITLVFIARDQRRKSRLDAG